MDGPVALLSLTACLSTPQTLLLLAPAFVSILVKDTHCFSFVLYLFMIILAISSTDMFDRSHLISGPSYSDIY